MRLPRTLEMGEARAILVTHTVGKVLPFRRFYVGSLIVAFESLAGEHWLLTWCTYRHEQLDVLRVLHAYVSCGQERCRRCHYSRVEGKGLRLLPPQL